MPAHERLPDRYTLAGYHEARFNVKPEGVRLELVSDGGNTYTNGTVNWDTWDAFIAWVEWRRKELIHA